MKKSHRTEDLINYSKYIQMCVKCKKCGHTILVARKDRIICSYCGNWVYKNDKTEFEYKMKEKLKK